MSRFRRRLMGLSTLRPHIKDEFVRVEYIENPSYAYINTLFKPNNKTKIEVSVELVNINKLQWIYGARNDQQNSSLAILYGAKVGTANLNYGYLRYDFGNKQNSNNNFIENKKWKISNESNVLTYTDGTEENTYTITCANNSFTCNYNLYLFNLNNRNTVSNSNAFLGKIYSCKIYEDDVLVRNYIPVLNKATDEYGMYDLVEQKFYTSPNGAKFVGGREIIYDAEIEYLEKVSGTNCLINLGTNADAIFEITAQATTITNSSMTLINRHTASTGGSWFGVPVVKNRCWGLAVTKGAYSSVSSLNKTNITVDFTVNPVVGTINGSTFSRSKGFSNMNWYLFGAANYSYPFIGRLYSLKAYIGDKLTFDLIPVRVGNVGYMYDKVSNKLFGNNGSGNFILGKDVEVYDKI